MLKQEDEKNQFFYNFSCKLFIKIIIPIIKTNKKT